MLELSKVTQVFGPQTPLGTQDAARPLVSKTGPAATAPDRAGSVPPSEDEEADAERAALTAAGKRLAEALPDVPDLTRLKLSIERNEDAQSFVYKFLDQETGEVVKQWPLEQAVKLLEFWNERSGLVVDEQL